MRATDGAVCILAEASQGCAIAPYTDPDNINVIVVGGETQALWLTTDMWHTKTVSIDKWRPKSGAYRRTNRPRAGARRARNGMPPR